MARVFSVEVQHWVKRYIKRRAKESDKNKGISKIKASCISCKISWNFCSYNILWTELLQKYWNFFFSFLIEYLNRSKLLIKHCTMVVLTGAFFEKNCLTVTLIFVLFSPRKTTKSSKCSSQNVLKVSIQIKTSSPGSQSRNGKQRIFPHFFPDSPLTYTNKIFHKGIYQRWPKDFFRQYITQQRALLLNFSFLDLNLEKIQHNFY